MPGTGSTRRKRAAKDSASTVRERFIEQMGIVAQGDGLPRIAGRMMGLMIFDGRPYSFSELATELQVSRGSVSTNARILEQMGILERTAVPGERQDYFQLADAPFEAVLSGALARSRKARQIVLNTAEALRAKGQSGPKGRLEEYGAFYSTIIDALESATSNRD